MKPASPNESSVAEDAQVNVFDGVRALALDLQPLHNQLLSQTTENFTESLTRLVNRLDAFTSRDADAALASMQLDLSEDGLASRLLHAAVLCRVFATALEMDKPQRLSILAAALTYDVALTPIAPVLNRQNAPLSPEQRMVIEAHPGDACALLKHAGLKDPICLAAVLHHHERVDGTGYPGRLTGDAISLPGRVLGIVDTFSAMVRSRAYRDALLSRQALRDIFIKRSASMDERLANIFVKKIGMHPPGSLVRLANREIAVVVRRGVNMAQPEVRVVINADNSLALRHPARDTRQDETAIVEGLPIQKYRSVLHSIKDLWKPS